MELKQILEWQFIFFDTSILKCGWKHNHFPIPLKSINLYANRYAVDSYQLKKEFVKLMNVWLYTQFLFLIMEVLEQSISR